MHGYQGIIAATLIGFGALATGCSDDESDIMDTRASTTADFTSFRTFAFTGPSDMNPDVVQNIPTDIAVNLASVTSAMREELTELGLVEVTAAESPDLRAFSLASTSDEQSVYWTCTDSYWYGYWYWSWAPCDWLTPVYTEYTAGTLLVGLVDPKEDEFVFGSLIQGVGDDTSDFADRIDEDIDEVFDEYPEDQTGL